MEHRIPLKEVPRGGHRPAHRRPPQTPDPLLRPEEVGGNSLAASFGSRPMPIMKIMHFSFSGYCLILRLFLSCRRHEGQYAGLPRIRWRKSTTTSARMPSATTTRSILSIRMEAVLLLLN